MEYLLDQLDDILMTIEEIQNIIVNEENEYIDEFIDFLNLEIPVDNTDELFRDFIKYYFLIHKK